MHLTIVLYPTITLYMYGSCLSHQDSYSVNSAVIPALKKALLTLWSAELSFALESPNLYKGLNKLIMIVSGYGYKKQKATRND